MKRKVGKKIGQVLYIHKSALNFLDNNLIDLVKKRELFITEEFKNYDIIKIDKKTQEVSFIKSENWDLAHEPFVGDSLKVFTDDSIKITKARKSNKQIYHHKWMFVCDDYNGFNVEESKRRSENWLSLCETLNIDRKKIGNFDYWNLKVIPYLTETKWYRGKTDKEIRDKFPNLFSGKFKDSSKYKNHPTQVKNTVSTYQKIFIKLKNDNFNGNILDASSGMGFGTKLGRNMGLNIDDVELYPPKGYRPIYTSYEDIVDKYNTIISNMVLNILPQDIRDDLLLKMFNLLKKDGKLYIIVRQWKDIENQKSGIPINNPVGEKDINCEYYYENKKSYQKGFKKDELFFYVEDILSKQEIRFSLDILNYQNSGLKNHCGLIITKYS